MATVPIPLNRSAVVQMKPRKRTRGYAQIPNAVVENQALFTHSELCFLLVMFRRGGGAETVISDRNWETWTGLKDRQKHYAIAGLRQKGLEFEGKGDTAVYRFSWKQFDEFLRTAKPDDLRPKTKGRSVTAPPKFQVHKDCAANGCAKLDCEECEGDDVQRVAQNGAIGSNDTGAAGLVLVQPVAQNGACKKFKRGGVGSRFVCQNCNLSKAAHVQRVAQKEGAAAAGTTVVSVQRVAQFRESYDWIRERYVTAGIDLVWALAHSVEPACSDAELLEALQRATEATRGRQKFEGLYARTVPTVIASMRLAARPAPVKRADLSSVIAGLKEFAGRDPRFAPVVAGMVAELRSVSVSSSPELLSAALEAIETPLRRQLLEVARNSGSDAFLSTLKKIEAAADAMGLNGTAKRSQVEALAVIDAQILLDAPSVWGLLQS